MQGLQVDDEGYLVDPLKLSISVPQFPVFSIWK
jgi:hypothetical protein